MQALLLAGGMGTRLRSVVSDRPKPMALVEDKPFLEYLIKELKNNNITDIIILSGYKGKMIEEYFTNGLDFGVNIQYSYEDVPLGTAGAIKNAEALIVDDFFFVLNADTFYKLDYNELVEVQEKKQLDMALVLREVSDVSRYGKAELKNNLLVGFNEKENKCQSGTINGGVYYIHKKVLELIPKEKCSLENDIIPKLMKGNYRLGGIVNAGYFIDIGIPEDYFKFINDVKSSEI